MKSKKLVTVPNGGSLMWLNCQPLWLKEPTFEKLKDISIRFSGALAKQFPKVAYWAVTSETAYSWGNTGFLEPEQIIDITKATCEAIKQVNPQAHCGINNIIFVCGDAAVHYDPKSPRIVGTHKFYQMCTDANVPSDFNNFTRKFMSKDTFRIFFGNRLCPNVTFRPTTPPQKIYAAASLAEFSGFFQLPGNSSSILPAG